MYLDHFGLNEQPFSLTPDTGYYYGRASHQEALNVLLFALEGGEGFIKITGEVGTGKTLLCRRLLADLEGETWTTAFIPNPDLSPDELRRVVARELYIGDEAETSGQENTHDTLGRIQTRLLALAGEGRRVVLIVDEAQTMPDETLEAMRLLTNLETERQKLLQVVLFGQPELDERLAAGHLRQLRQRCTFAHRLSPLRREQVEDYLHHRLQTAGYRGMPLFNRRVSRLLGWSSGGIPRTLNTLAHKSMLAAYGDGGRRITPGHAWRAIRDTETARRGWLRPHLAALGLG